MLIHNHQLSAVQLSELDRLCERCKIIDGHVVPIYKHLIKKNRPVSQNVLYYHQKQLVGFLSTFYFYQDACEIALMVEPSYRRQGIATQLLNVILPVLCGQKITELIFSAPADQDMTWFGARGANFIRREYQMQRKGGEQVSVVNQSLIIRLATLADEPVLCSMDKISFPLEISQHSARFAELLQDQNYKIFIAEMNQTAIGKAHLHFELEDVRLSDIAILPQYQKQGFGSTLLAFAINYALDQNYSTLILDVETTNQQAIKLYSRLGFLITNVCDYWSIPVEVLRLTKH